MEGAKVLTHRVNLSVPHLGVTRQTISVDAWNAAGALLLLAMLAVACLWGIATRPIPTDAQTVAQMMEEK